MEHLPYFPGHSKPKTKASPKRRRHATMPRLPPILTNNGDGRQILEEINRSLPPNWEARLDAHGRVFYLDHINRSTTWDRPPSTINLGNNSIMKIKLPQARITEIEVAGRSIGSDTNNHQSDKQAGNSNGNSNSQSNSGQKINSNNNTTTDTTNTTTNNNNNQHRKNNNHQSQYHNHKSKENHYSNKSNGNNIININNNNIANVYNVNNVNSSSSSRVNFADTTEQHRTLLDRRYTLRRTISIKKPLVHDNLDSTLDSSQLDSSMLNSSNISEPTSIKDISNVSHDSVDSGATTASVPIVNYSQISSKIACPPALKFLKRSDFYNILHLNDDALKLFNQSKNLKYIIGKVRKSKSDSEYERFQHNKDLVALLNLFAQRDQPLPHGWAKKHDHQNKLFFLDHIRRTTTYVDPRLPVDVPLINPVRNPLHENRPIPPGAQAVENPSSSTSSSSNQQLQPSTSGLNVDDLRAISLNDTNEPKPSTSSVNENTQQARHLILSTLAQQKTNHSNLQLDLSGSSSTVAGDTSALIQLNYDPLSETSSTGFANSTSESLPIPPTSGTDTQQNNDIIISAENNSDPTNCPSQQDQIRASTSSNRNSSILYQSTPSTSNSSNNNNNNNHNINHSNIGYEAKIVAFFKQPQIFDVLKERRLAASLLNSSLRDKINEIRKGGLNSLKKFSHDVNLMMIISLFDTDIDAYSNNQNNSGSSSQQTHSSSSRVILNVSQNRNPVGRLFGSGRSDFEDKLRYFYRKLEQKNFGQGPNKLKLGIRRDHILEDSFTKVMSVNGKKDLQKSRLYVSFAGEEGLDYGGPSREFFFLLSRELFNPYYGK